MIQGLITALVTPFNEKNEVDYKVLADLVEEQINANVDGLLILGTTAETPSLTEKEEDEIVDFVVKYNNKRVKIIVGVCSNNTITVLEKCQRYGKYDIDAFLAITPYYNKTNESGMIKHFISIADNTNKPIILYNVPKRTGICISLAAIRSLRNHKNIIGIKEASGDMAYLEKVMLLSNDKFAVYCGDDAMTLPALAIGAKGVISVASNVIPAVVNELIEAYNKGEIVKAREIHEKYLEFMNLLFIETSPIPIKEVMNYKGYNVGEVRLPLGPMSEENKRLLINEARRVI